MIWQTRPVGDVFDVVGGGTPSKKRPEYYGGAIPWATIRDMHSAELADTEHTITEEGLRASSAKVVPAGEVIMASRVGLGKACLLKQSTAINQDIRALLPKEPQAIDRRFCLYWLQSIKDRIIGAGSGATVQGVKLPFIKSLPFPDVGLEEQKRIVAVLDQAFAALDRARANAEANLVDAEELFDNALEEVFAELSVSSQTKSLSDAVHPDCKLSYGIVQPGDQVDSGLPIVRPVDLKSRTISKSGLKRISPDKADGYARTKLTGEELLLCVRGSTGVVSMATAELAGANVTRGIVPIRFLADQVDLDFAYFQMRSPFARKQIADKTYGAALMQINIKDLRALNFVVPSLAVQRETIKRVEQLLEQSEALMDGYRTSIEDLDDLRQSILQKAFAGELV